MILCKKYPFDRCDFHWIKLDKIALLYGGAASPSEIYYDDLWMFKYDDFDFASETKKEVQKDYWSEINQTGTKPGKIRAYSMEYSLYDDCLYLYGGLDSKKKNKSDLFRYDISKNIWEIVKTKGKSPGERCYHEMALINKDNMVVFGGIKGSIPTIEVFYNDVYLYNIIEAIWVEPVIGGIQPNPTLGFSLCCNYNYDKMEILLIGGHHAKETENNKPMRIHIITQNGIVSIVNIIFRS